MPTATAPTTTDRIRLTLEAEIGTGVWMPGQALDEQALSERFQVSRTPVREALLQLSALGFVDVVPRAGIFVRALSQDEANTLFEALACLEGLCAGLAAERLSAGMGKRLARAHRLAGPPAHKDAAAAYEKANHQFHDLIYACAGNTYLASQVSHIRRRTYAYRLMQFNRTDRARQSHTEHERILHAVLKGDAEEASLAAIEHIAQGRQDFREFVSRCADGLFAARAPARRGRRPALPTSTEPPTPTGTALATGWMRPAVVRH